MAILCDGVPDCYELDGENDEANCESKYMPYLKKDIVHFMSFEISTSLNNC